MGFFSFLRRDESRDSSSAQRSTRDIDKPLNGMGTVLFNACLAGDSRLVQSLLESGADPNVRSFVSYPGSDLFNPEMPREVGALLFENIRSHRINPEFFFRPELGFTNLYFPARHGDVDTVRILVEHGADPNAICCNGLFPLYAAAEIGNLHIVMDLVRFGVDVNKRTPKGNTAILNAAEEGHLNVVKYLLEHGADPYIRNDAGSTAIDAAIRCGQMEVARYMGSHTSSRGPLHGGDATSSLGSLLSGPNKNDKVQLNVEDLASTLVEHSKDAMLGVYGTEVMWAFGAVSRAMAQSESDSLQLSTLLAFAEADNTIASFLMYVTKNYYLVRAIIEEDVPGVKTVLQQGTNPNSRCRYKGTLHTPIVAAARTGNIEICKLLVGAGADVNLSQSNSETALANAAMLGDYFMTEFLLESGAKPDAVTYAGTALALADNTAIIGLLEEYGANPNIPDSDGDLPIIGFIDQGRYEIVRMLVTMDTDLEHRNKRGESAIDRAKKSGDPTIVQIVVNGESYCLRNHPSIPHDLARVLGSRILKMICLNYPLDKYQDHIVINGCDKNVDEYEKYYGVVQEAIEAKRSGDLERANDLYIGLIKENILLRTDYVWGWFKVLLLAKSYRDARLVLRYYHALSSSFNRLRRDKGELDFENTTIPESFLTQDFEAMPVFQDCTNVCPLDRSGVEEKIRAFGGGPMWADYSMSDGEYDSFLLNFCLDSFYQDGVDESDDDNENDREWLEAEARAGSNEAYVPLARLIYKEDRERAIDLCERAMAEGDESEAPFFLAWLLSDTFPERSKQIYEKLISDGDHYASPNNLALLIQKENPDRAASLFQMAIDNGNTKLATANLADMIEAEDPERAIELYESAISAGNEYAARTLANLLRDSDPDRAKELYWIAIDAGDEYASTFQLALLIKDEDPGQAKELFERSIAAGDRHYAPFFLALLLKDQPEAAANYYRMAPEEGNNYARVELAKLIYNKNRQQAIDLCEAAVADGDVREGACFLAWLLEGENPERSKELYQACIDNGYYFTAANSLANLIKADDPERAAKLYQMSIDAGNVSSYSRLARLVSDTDRDRAIGLCEQAIERGDVNDAPYYLAWMLESEDPERAKKLYQVCVDNGYCYNAANNLANLIKADDPDRAKALFELSLKTGNAYYAAMNLADMLAETDPERAAKLYQMSIDAGNVSSYSLLARLVGDTDRDRAIGLCEQAIEKGDVNDAPFYLAWMVADEDPERAKRLYQVCVDNGYCYGAANNLANLIDEDDPERAKELYNISIEAGNVVAGACNLAHLIKDESPEKAFELYIKSADAGQFGVLNDGGISLMQRAPSLAIKLFELAMDRGETEYAACNLAHMLVQFDPARAESLYRLALQDKASPSVTEALIGLGVLLETKSPEESKACIEKALVRNDARDSAEFMINYYDGVNAEYAERIRGLLDAIDAGKCDGDDQSD